METLARHHVTIKLTRQKESVLSKFVPLCYHNVLAVYLGEWNFAWSVLTSRVFLQRLQFRLYVVFPLIRTAFLLEDARFNGIFVTFSSNVFALNHNKTLNGNSVSCCKHLLPYWYTRSEKASLRPPSIKDPLLPTPPRT